MLRKKDQVLHKEEVQVKDKVIQEQNNSNNKGITLTRGDQQPPIPAMNSKSHWNSCKPSYIHC